MHYRSESLGATNHSHRTRRVQRTFVRAFALTLVGALAASVFIERANAQSAMPPAMDSVSPDAGAPPMSQSGGGDIGYFSQDLSSIVRLRYSTQSYGQDGTGNFDLGTFQIVTMDDTAAFFDGQVTMNESDGVGFNLGLGYRWMNYPDWAANSGRMDGISLFADGTHTEAGNFFPQVGVSYESLGEKWDVRANGYIPIGDKEQVGAFKATNVIGFEGNSIANITKATVDKPFYAAEVEIARRLGDQRDAWGFAGPYFVGNDDQDSAGFRAGLRGYAYPDLLLQFAVSNDDIFKTQATFSAVWYVGRTRTDYRPSCGTPDRFRESVMRNDYVVLSHKTRLGGNALTNPDGTALRIVHVDSNSAAGGNGTFEHPFNALTDVNGTGSQTGDILFAHSTSVFSGESSVLLKDNQRLLGEGNGLVQTVATKQKGTINIPESSPGARALARPQINGFTGDAITMANGNEVSNFDIDGQNVTARAIAAPVAGSGNPNLNHLSIKNTTGNGIDIASATITDPTDATKQIVQNNATINTVTFDNVGGDDIKINSGTTTDLTDPNVTLQETIAVSNVTSTNGGGAGVRLIDTHSTHSATITNYTNGNATAGSGGGLAGEGVLRFEGSATDKFEGNVTISNADIKNNIGFAFDFLNVKSTSTVTLGTGSSWDGGTGAAGGFRANNFNGTVNATSTTLTGGTLGGISLLNASAGTFNFDNTVTLTNIGGTDVNVDGGAGDLFTGTANIASVINNTDGRSVSIQGVSGTNAAVTLSGNIKDTALGILVNSNSGGQILFASDLDMDTTTHTAVTVTDNTGASVDFPGKVDIVTTTGDGFVATGGGTLTMSAANNTITTDTGQILKITGMTIDTNTNVKVADVNRTAGAATNAIQLENNTGGSIDIGTVTDTAGGAGTIAGGTADAILIRNSANVSVNGVRINNTSAVAGITVDKTTNTAMTVSVGNVETNGGSTGINVTGHGTTANLNMTIDKTAINSATTTGLSFNDVDAGTIGVTATNIDGNNAGVAAGGVSIVNSNATFNFDSATQIHESSGNDFEVNGGAGTISYDGTIVNSSATNPADTTGHSVRIHNVTGGSVTFGQDNTVNDTNQGMLVDTNTGGTFQFNGAYTLATLANDAVTVTKNTGATTNLSGLDITTSSGQGLVATGGGTLSVQGTGTNTVTRTAGAAAGSAVDIENMTIGSVDIKSVNATGGVNGVRLVNNTGGTVTIGDPGNVVDAGGTITGTTDAAVHAQNTNVILNGVTAQDSGNASTDNAVEILHTNATAMTSALNHVTVRNPTATGNGVVIDGAGGSGNFTADVENLTVDVAANGFVAQNGVTLTAGGTNTINSATGVGLTLNNMAISGTGANFQSVDVTAGATNGVVMTNVTGGQVAITGIGATADSGGLLTTTGGDAIVLSNVTNVDLDNMRIVSAVGQGVNIDHTLGAANAMDVTIERLNLDASTGNGIDVLSATNTNAFSMRLLDSDLEKNVVMNNTGSGAFGLLVDNNDITTTGTDVAFNLTFSGATAQTGNVTFSNGNAFLANNASALAISTSGAAFKTVNLLVADSTFTNDSASPASNITSGGNAQLNATIQGNTFTNNTGSDFLMTASGAQGRILLNLGGDTAADFNTAGGTGNFDLTNSAGVFNVFEKTATFPPNNARNTGTVVPTGAINDSATAPPLPTGP
jgi:hypothetical protein